MSRRGTCDCAHELTRVASHQYRCASCGLEFRRSGDKSLSPDSTPLSCGFEEPLTSCLWPTCMFMRRSIGKQVRDRAFATTWYLIWASSGD